MYSSDLPFSLMDRCSLRPVRYAVDALAHLLVGFGVDAGLRRVGHGSLQQAALQAANVTERYSRGSRATARRSRGGS
jgi:hypothetical protein